VCSFGVDSDVVELHPPISTTERCDGSFECTASDRRCFLDRLLRDAGFHIGPIAAAA